MLLFFFGFNVVMAYSIKRSNTCSTYSENRTNWSLCKKEISEKHHCFILCRCASSFDLLTKLWYVIKEPVSVWGRKSCIFRQKCFSFVFAQNPVKLLTIISAENINWIVTTVFLKSSFYFWKNRKTAYIKYLKKLN